MVTLTILKDSQDILISFAQELECVYFLFQDTEQLLQKYTIANNSIILTEEEFSDYLYYNKTIPILVSMDLKENVKRVEYAWNDILSRLQKELAEDCERFLLLAQDITKEQEATEFLDTMTEQAERIMSNAKNQIAKLSELEFNELARERIGGWIDDSGVNGGGG